MSNEVQVALVAGVFSIVGALAGYFFQRSSEKRARNERLEESKVDRLNGDVIAFASLMATAIHKLEWLTWMAKNYQEEGLVRAEVKRYQESMYTLWAQVDAALLTVAAQSISTHGIIRLHEERLRKLDEEVARSPSRWSSSRPPMRSPSRPRAWGSCTARPTTSGIPSGPR